MDTCAPRPLYTCPCSFILSTSKLYIAHIVAWYDEYSTLLFAVAVYIVCHAVATWFI